MSRDLSTYRHYRSVMRTGDLVEMRSRSLVGWGIRLVTGQRVNHTAMIIRLSEYDMDRVFLLEALEHGIALTLLSRRLERYRGKVWWLSLDSTYSHLRPAIGRNALKYVGVKYDFAGVARQIFGKISANARRLFCSEFAYMALLESGLPVGCEKAPQPGEMYGLGVFGRPVLIKD